MSQPRLFDLSLPRPPDCPHETRRADIGAGKSECAAMGCWTSCLEAGRCVAYDLGKVTEEYEVANGQMLAMQVLHHGD